MNHLDAYMRIVFPVIMKVNIMVLKEMTPYFSGDGYRRFGANCYHFFPEDESSMIVENFVAYQITRRLVPKAL